MKKITFCFILLFISCPALFAQTPSWVVNENDYQHTMTFVAKLNVNGKQLINTNDKVAAFVGNVCRGVSGVTYVANEKTYYAFLTVFSNTQGESITFKLHESSTNKITTVSKQTIFRVNEHKGNQFQSYSIAEPRLNDKAEVLSFNFMDIKSLSSSITGSAINVSIFDSYSLTNLKPVFTLSMGANLYKNRIQQTTGNFTENFSSAIVYEVLSEDESTLSNYKINVSQVIDLTLFYKKDAVCYARGAIKIVSKREGTTAQITSNGKTVSSKQITNGEALFPNLDAGSYIATLGTQSKNITILLKEK